MKNESDKSKEFNQKKVEALYAMWDKSNQRIEGVHKMRSLLIDSLREEKDIMESEKLAKMMENDGKNRWKSLVFKAKGWIRKWW